MQTMMVKRGKRPAMEIEASYGLHPPEQWMGAVLRLGWEGSGLRGRLSSFMLFQKSFDVLPVAFCETGMEQGVDLKTRAKGTGKSKKPIPLLRDAAVTRHWQKLILAQAHCPLPHETFIVSVQLLLVLDSESMSSHNTQSRYTSLLSSE